MKYGQYAQKTVADAGDIIPTQDGSSGETMWFELATLRDFIAKTINMSNTRKFDVYRNGAQSLAAATSTKVQFETELYDTGGNYDTASYRFVAPAAGFYTFKSAALVNCGSGQLYCISLYKNGTEIRRGTQILATANAAYGFVVAEDLQLAQNDYVEVFMFNGAAGASALSVGQAFVYFSGHLISTT